MTRAWQKEFELLASLGVSITPGLTERELVRVEAVLTVPLPPDLRSFLSEGLPLAERFVNWREPESESIRAQLAWPYEGIAFDIEHNHFWLDEWGARPASLADALGIARQRVAEAPRLIPISGHRYLPAEPCLAGNPVLSVHQTDIICYGSDLSHYLQREFYQITHEDAVRAEIRRIRFWDYFVGGEA